jgi:hypothetical protein
MDEKAIHKVLKIFGSVFIFVSIIELISIVLLWNSTLTLDGNQISFQYLILRSKILPSYAKFLFLFLVISICFFIIVGILHWKMISKIDLNDDINSKKVFLFAVLILILSYIKMGYIAFLGSIMLKIGYPITLQSAIYDDSITPFYVQVIWNFFISVVCCYLTIGIIEGGIGLKWATIVRDRGIEEKINQ